MFSITSTIFVVCNTKRGSYYQMTFSRHSLHNTNWNNHPNTIWFSIINFTSFSRLKTCKIASKNTTQVFFLNFVNFSVNNHSGKIRLGIVTETASTLFLREGASGKKEGIKKLFFPSILFSALSLVSFQLSFPYF